MPVPFALKTSVLRPPIPARVLVVDDEPLIRWSLCTALAAAGFDAVSAANGVEARQLATEWPPPRIALVDAGAEDVGDLLAYVRHIYPECGFVLMTTGQPLQRYRGKAIDVIEKPFDVHRVILLIRRLIEDS